MDEKILIHSANSPDVYHWGINGQQWGKRRYQNEDGSLTPLGRVHYGVGQAREASKIKMREMKAETRNAVKLAKAQAKTANAVAKAEVKKLEAEAKAYKNRKEADNMVELERVKNDREADRDSAKLEEKRISNDEKANKALAESAKEQSEAEKESSKAVKVAIGVLAAAGVGYLLYKAAKGSSATSEANVNAGKSVINSVRNQPASSMFDSSKEIARQNKIVEKTINADKKAAAAFAKRDAKAVAKETARQTKMIKNIAKASKKAEAKFAKQDAKATAKEIARQSKMVKDAIKAENTPAIKFAKSLNTILNDINWRDRFGITGVKHSDIGDKQMKNMILVHSANGPDVCHYGVKGQRWGVITKKEDAPSSGRTKNVTGTTSGATVDKTTSYGGNGSKGRSKNDEYLGKATAQTAALACYAVLTGKMTREQAVARMKRSSREQKKTWENVNGGWKKASEKIGNFDGDDLHKYDYDTFINTSVEKFNLMMDGINEPGNESLKKQIMDFGKRAEAINNRKNLTAQVKADQAKKSENAPKQYDTSDKKQKTGTMLSSLKTKDKGKLNSNFNNSVKLKKVKLKHSDGQDFYFVHSEYGEDIEHWGIKGQKWGVRRWQYEDGSLTPEGREHYGRISEKGQQEGKLKGAVAKGNTRIYNQLTRRMSRNAEKYEKTGKRKYAEKALENAEWMNDEDYVKKQGKLSADMYYAHLIAGLPGQIITGAVHSKDMADVNQIWKDTKAKFQNMSLDELDKAFKETIGKTEKVKFNAKEMDKETKAKEAKKIEELAEKEYIKRNSKDAKEAREAIENEKLDLIDEGAYFKDTKRADNAAKLGIKALIKEGRDYGGDLDPNDKYHREWFIEEDQTIGLGTIADMVNQGKSKAYIIKTLENIDKADYSVDEDTQDGIAALSWCGYDSSKKNNDIEKFIDACIEIKKDEEKKRG
ncbi:MAG: hypothetical protein J5617_04000 [Bacilli bacterium]|nr:hypothetical protein [Bacilli bacterium]